MAFSRTLQHFTSSQELATIWASGQSYIVNQLVLNNDIIYRCLIANTSSISFSTDLGAGKWVEVSASAAGTKNYISNGNFEQNTDTGWSLASSTLDATTKLPNQVSASWTAASGSLAKSVISSGQLAGSYSLQLSSTAATTAGNMLVTDALVLDLEAQSTIQTFSFYYKVSANGITTNVTTSSGSPSITVADATGLVIGMVLNSANAGGTITNIVGTTITLSNNATATGTVSGTFINTLSGTSSNPLGVAIYDATNHVWIQPAGVFNLVQGSGVGLSSGTFQVPSNCTSVRLAVYFPNSSGASGGSPFTVIFDDFQLGPQKVLAGVPVTGMENTYTPTFGGGGLGTPTNVSFKWQRIADKIIVRGTLTTGTVTAAAGTISLPFGSIDETKTIGPNIGGSTRGIVGRWFRSNGNASNAKWGSIAFTGSAQTTVALTNSDYTTALNPFSPPNISAILVNTDQLDIEFEYYANGLSSNTVMSQDTDTRVVAARAFSSNSGAWPTTDTVINFATVSYDTHSVITTGAGWNYRVPVSGYYKVSASHEATSSGATTLILRIRKNGSQFATGTFPMNAATSNIIVRVDGQNFFNAGDTIDIAASSSAGTGTFVGSASASVVQIERLSGPSTIAASETVAFSANTSTTSVAAGSLDVMKVIIMSSVAVDTHAAYNVSTGAYTIPVSGKYLINGNGATSSTLVHFRFGFSIDSTSNYTALDQTYAESAGIIEPGSFSSVVSLNAGQVIRFGASAGSPVSMLSDSRFNFVSIVRIGS